MLGTELCDPCWEIRNRTGLSSREIKELQSLRPELTAAHATIANCEEALREASVHAFATLADGVRKLAGSRDALNDSAAWARFADETAKLGRPPRAVEALRALRGRVQTWRDNNAKADGRKVFEGTVQMYRVEAFDVVLDALDEDLVRLSSQPASQPMGEKEAHWLCPCNYYNNGPICTKCGRLKPAPAARSDAMVERLREAMAKIDEDSWRDDLDPLVAVLRLLADEAIARLGGK